MAIRYPLRRHVAIYLPQSVTSLVFCQNLVAKRVTSSDVDTLVWKMLIFDTV